MSGTATSPSEPNRFGARGLVPWFVRNTVASNLLMFALLVGGIVTALDIRQEVFPSFQLEIIDVRIPYPGASPEQIEDGLLLPIEEQLRGLEVVDRVVGIATEGSAKLEVELLEGVDSNRALQDVTTALDRISFFPEEAERPTIQVRQERDNVMWMVVYGPLDERAIFELAERVRSDLIDLPEVSLVELRLARTPEISFEIPEATLRSLRLTTGDVADVIRASARDLPGGGVRTPGGEYLLRTAERRDFASAYGDIVLVSNEGGTKVRLADVARIDDGFQDRSVQNKFNGGSGVFLTVFQGGGEKPLEIADAVNGYLAQLRASLPAGVDVQVLRDRAEQYGSRLKLLLGNGVLGLMLVLGVLGLFLEPRLALWVAVGIPTTIAGSLVFMPAVGASVNMISLFAFIITLGIVVDDAVIVGENVFQKLQEGQPRLQAALEGSREMIVPVIFAVSTNIIAFVPLLFVPGETGRFFSPLPLVVIAVFTVSLVEALLILPAHLGHGRGRSAGEAQPTGLRGLQARCVGGFDGLRDRGFTPALRRCLHHRYLTLAAVAAFVVVSWAYYASGRVDYTFNPVITSTRVDAELLAPAGAPFESTLALADRVEAAGVRAAERLGGGDEVVRGRMNVVGRRSENSADVNFILVDPSERAFSEAEFAAAWRDEIGALSGIDSLFFEWEEGPGSGAGLTIEVSHPEGRVLERAATELAERLAGYQGVTDVKDGIAEGKPQLDVELTPEGRSLGLTPEDVGRQVRRAFYGAEALRFQRGRHEVKVMVRLPAEERRSIAAVEDLMIRLPGGGEASLSQVAHLVHGRAETEVRRVNGRRVLEVTCNVRPELANVNDVRAALEAEVFPGLREESPGLELGYQGRQREEARAMARLQKGLLLALLAIFALLAGLFRSYAEALVVLSVIPVALAAALWGHVLLGYDLSVVSLFGMIALCGLVVNGGLVLNEEMKAQLGRGHEPFRAALLSGSRRFRPVLLTSLTTFAGLAPIILEDAPQAKFLVPMAIALGFGVLVSGIVLLVSVPAMLLILDDARGLFSRERRVAARTSAALAGEG